MKRICYVSRSIIGLSGAQFDDLATSSIGNNARNNITGLLLYDENRFLQAVEGEDSVIDALFGKIAKDRRHRDILVFESISISEREFGNWSLRTRSIHDLTPHDFKRRVYEDIQSVKSLKLKAMFVGFSALVRC